MDPLAIIELQRWGFPGVTKCRHQSIEFLTTQADKSKRDILIDYVLNDNYNVFSRHCKEVSFIKYLFRYIHGNVDIIG